MAFSGNRTSLKRDRLKQLRMFYYAASMESITKAAEHLGVAQPTVSTQVRELENELGAALFDRSGRGISRTPAGEILCQLVAPLVEGIDDLVLNFSEQLRDITSGDLRIGISRNIATIVLSPHLRHFRDLYPRIHLTLRRTTKSDASRLLLADEADLLLGPEDYVPTSVDREKIDYRPLFSYDLVLATSTGHPLAGRESVTREDVVGYPAIVPHAGMYDARFGESPIQWLGLEANAAIQADGWNTITRHVEAGLGIAIIPSICISDKDQVSTIPLTRYFESRTFGLFTRIDKSLSPAAKHFVELIEHRYADAIAR